MGNPDLRTPGEIMGEFASDYWSARDWQLVYDGVKQAQQEAVEVYEPVLRELREALRPLRVETDPAAGTNKCTEQVQRYINAKDAAMRLLGEIPCAGDHKWGDWISVGDSRARAARLRRL